MPEIKGTIDGEATPKKYVAANDHDNALWIFRHSPWRPQLSVEGVPRLAGGPIVLAVCVPTFLDQSAADGREEVGWWSGIASG